MKAKVVKAFPGRPDHEALTRTIEVDEIIEGELAGVAVRENWAKEIQPSTEYESSSDDVDLEKLKVDELKERAAAEGIDLGEAKTKAEIIAVIVAASAPKE